MIVLLIVAIIVMAVAYTIAWYGRSGAFELGSQLDERMMQITITLFLVGCVLIGYAILV